MNDIPLPLEDIPSAPVRQGTLGPMQVQHQRICLKPGRTGLFPPVWFPPPSKQKNNPKLQLSPHAMPMPKQATEKCSWGLHCPMKKNMEKRIGMAIYKISQECTPKTFSPRLYKILNCRIFNVHSHKPFSIPNHKLINMLRNKSFNSLSPSHSHSHKAPSFPSQRTIKNHLTFQIDMQNR